MTINKKGIAIFPFILYTALALILIYLILLLPVPAFAFPKSIINYVIILVIWILVQAGLIYTYYKLGSYLQYIVSSSKGFVERWTTRILKFVKP